MYADWRHSKSLSRTAWGRGVGALLALVAAVVSVAVLAPGMALAAAGSPGTPQEPTTVFDEGFQNQDATAAPILLTNYSGAGGLKYTADPVWLTACNGDIVNFNTPTAQKGSCNLESSATATRKLAYALGVQNGTADPPPTRP